ncbi:glycogen/starch/alpha-glucan phosphorylase [Thalassotalea sp. HSM 43]|uniref:glycogen/starch/alpha-glucan phosphorylase n=1 Tax=Thalassotalea sp. HSM 43 TaxID=2552945 RepID=UPI00108189E5|nr:glycogen/starch/alpha-glucan phosphorylase [Thalassotalea sp. HSM 43]QBY04345.1 glycogen/starch/alpha-glucan phosphorylase [Thalassotalea sp. HSM 43]
MATANKKPFTAAQFKKKVLQHLNFTCSQQDFQDNPSAVQRAVCMAVNEVVYEKLSQTNNYHQDNKTRSINYLSLEYLMGRMLSNNLHNLNLFDTAKKAVAELGFEIEDVFEEGHDLALGNGGLGRLAACFLDSLATMDFNAYGYGIHYQHGLFKQQFHEGRQIETPDEWREYGNAWEVCRPEAVQVIGVFGSVETIVNADGSEKKVWHPGQTIKGVPWDVPIVGYNSKTVNTLRLWESRASSFFDWDEFNTGAYQSAHAAQNAAETISKVLYPNDETEAGKELRFIQQYFFCACSIKDIIKRYQDMHGDDWSFFADKMVIQLNDTHPTIAILELMRILMDEYDFSWDDAFALCRKCFAYTNHTLLPEALEKWSVRMFERVLPRHLEILFSINEFFLNKEVAAAWPGDHQIRRRLSLIEEGQQQMVRMAHLCVVSSFKVNGVAQIHSDLVQSDLFPEFNALYPGKLTNVTNGVTPRRWLKACNPALSKLLDSKVKTDWPKDLASLADVAKFADDAKFQKQFMDIKHENKVKLAEEIVKTTGVEVDPSAIFDVQIKRLHEYKRQHLNFLHILALYRRLLDNPDYDMHPRVYIFGAKAAPGYYLAKEIIYAINKVADKINNDARIKGKLKVVFMPNYRVTLAEKIIPAADVSEQISTAGKEASGTGNMKLALNGAVTIGTLDGANVEIAEEVGDDNIFIFGNTVDQIKALNANGYNPYHYYETKEELKAVLDWLYTDYFTPGNPGELSAIANSVLDGGDPYRVMADFAEYCQANIDLDKAYKDKARWAKMAIINTAKMGKFTSDRSIQDYVDNIWKLEPIAE